MRIVTPKTAEGLSCAIAARQDGLGARNLISPAHHPHGGGIIYRASMKIVTPATADRLSVTITSRGGDIRERHDKRESSPERRGSVHREER